MTQAGASSPAAARRIAIWLLVMCGLVALMIIVGGATRLTDSGLSITEWRPVTGAIPPLNEAHWLSEFEKYKTIPEYEEVNYGMTLQEFKAIYWWEWGHRFLGRLIGIAFLVPMVVFMATGQVKKPLALKLLGLFVLGGLQGVLGWWMVSSGLADRVDVSQYRLAAHLSLAVIVFAAQFWLALDLWPVKTLVVEPKLRIGAIALSIGIFAQMILGAFVAGLRAGRTFNTWPLMDGKIIPDGYFTAHPRFHDLFETMAAVQFNHRLGAYLLAGAVLWFWLAARNSTLKRRTNMLAAMIGLQILLGIWTVLAATPIGLGLAHQAGAILVFAASLYVTHGARDHSG
ncbi:COX15/CtaA family protein [Hyphococcus sp. DH-69]|uniref:COX15/CtaA family protein n=1 Tax=Hyphococcus formosus TaxID=3143534 RepID=UPI00398A79D8